MYTQGNERKPEKWRKIKCGWEIASFIIPKNFDDLPGNQRMTIYFFTSS